MVFYFFGFQFLASSCAFSICDGVILLSKNPFAILAPLCPLENDF
jgi:hypothetical protein